MKKIPIIKKVYPKDKYDSIINTSFTQLISPISISNTEKEINVDDLFLLYETLFLQIPKIGENNSHQYLIKKSSEYVGDEFTNPLITELQDEITSLKQQILASSTTIGDLTSQLTNLGDSFKTFNK